MRLRLLCGLISPILSFSPVLTRSAGTPGRAICLGASSLGGRKELFVFVYLIIGSPRFSRGAWRKCLGQLAWCDAPEFLSYSSLTKFHRDHRVRVLHILAGLYGGNIQYSNCFSQSESAFMPGVFPLPVCARSTRGLTSTTANRCFIIKCVSKISQPNGQVASNAGTCSRTVLCTFARNKRNTETEAI